VRVHALQVGQDHITVQRVPVLHDGMLDDRIGNRVFVLAVELLAATRTRLAECHGVIDPSSWRSATRPR
jgi:hypothetical protein